MKVRLLNEAIAQISWGSTVAFGGNTMHRVPVAAVKELIVQEKRVHVIKSAGSLEVDALCAAGLAEEITFAYVGYENYGLAPFFRSASENGKTMLHEHTWPSLIAGLRAAAFGLSFMPLPGLGGSDIPKMNHWQYINDPYTEQQYLAIPAIQPDWAILHVQQADILGNARIFGSKFEDVILSRAARHLIITCEELLPEYSLTDLPETTDIPGFLVDAVVYAPRGAWPTSCYQHYPLDEKTIQAISKLKDEKELLKWLNNLSSPPASPLFGTALAKEHLAKEEKK